MKRTATQSNVGARSSSRQYRYTKVLDNRKHPIRGLWKRTGSFIARITVEDEGGLDAVKWVPLEAETAAEAKQEYDKLVAPQLSEK